ncbi:hypothetical protein GCM10007857_90680 [Bradyrhizobium iriomotense]|uniref:Transposase n=1 Tax=Bradyrhizobium iriomotense TaxID=441950 RepID=A0ABQ6BJE1_9BRAD|nr:hypothetical protein GCM10007857_90680 [Bradyrhizobium iriomotense]
MWSYPAAWAAIRKRVLRAVLEEIVVIAKRGHLELKLHWEGGDHTAL